jgi:putative ABC transport system permease protein
LKLYILFKQSLKAIFNNKVRSFLTIMGIVIGIGSVIALVSFGTGVKASISDRITTLGTTNLTIMSGAGFNSGAVHSGGATQGGSQGGGGYTQAASTLTAADLNSLADKSKHPQIKYISGQISGSTIFKTASGDQRYAVLGTSEAYDNIQNLSLSKGNFYKSGEVANKTKVIVLGSQLATDLYGARDAVGEKLTIEGSDYKIIGVLKEANESGFSNPNNQAYIPYTAAAETFKSQNFNSITVQAQNENVINDVKTDIKNTLLSNHQITDIKLADFNVSSSADLLSAVSGITTMLTALLAGIAAISLLVGGIGIMNIMLVSVTERTREIGLRKAVGAKTSDILGQFIMEAILLTICGGILGIGLGILIGKIASPSLGFTPIVSNNSILLAVGVSSLIGLIFGVYPAAKASMLNPIDALRYE